MKSIRNLALLFLLVSFFGGTILAQDGAKKAQRETDKTVLKLQQKVLLSDDQASKIKTILNSYVNSDKSAESLGEVQRKIEALLDEKQKDKYEIIKDDWWKSVNKIPKE
ncbi:MAG: hypothetical protein R6W90_18790 [Ignavibacteriaceae bacterium]